MDRRYLLFGAGAAAIAGAGAAYLVASGTGSMADYEAAIAVSRATLAQKPELAELVRFATLAPSGHNTQPWRFRVGANRIDILPDLARRTPVVDPDDHHLFVSLGCAAETLALAGRARGLPGELQFDATGGTLGYAFQPGAAEESQLFEAITTRQSTRTEFDGQPIAPEDLAQLAATAREVPGVDMVLVTERSAIDRLRDLVVAGNSAQMADPAFVDELKSWLRFNPREALDRGDGLFSATTNNPVVPGWLGRLMFDLVFRAASENDKYARQVDSSSGVGVFVAAKADPEHWVATGRACQRFALQATALGLKHAFVNQPVEVPEFRDELAGLVGFAGQRPDIVMRFGRGPQMPFSPRRTVASVLA